MFDHNRYILREYTITADRISKDATFVFLSDLHNKEYGMQNEALILDIIKINPDAILVAGDMITARESESGEQAISFLKKLAARYPVYYGFGNHESRMRRHPEVYQKNYQRFYQELEACGVCFLLNQNRILPEWNITIYGLELSAKYYKKTKKHSMDDRYMEISLGMSQNKDGMFNLLLAHNPEYFENYAKWGADLVLAGHIHGGIIRFGRLGGLISPSLRFFPKYDGGRFEIEKSTMILSRGLGMHTIPLRICNPAELIVLKLQKSM